MNKTIKSSIYLDVSVTTLQKKRQNGFAELAKPKHDAIYLDKWLYFQAPSFSHSFCALTRGEGVGSDVI